MADGNKSSEKLVLSSRDGRAAIITLNRPDRRVPTHLSALRPFVAADLLD